MSNRSIIGIVAILVLAMPVHASEIEDNVRKYGRGIIKDYSGMKESGDIEFVWIAPGVRLNSHRFEIGQVENLTSFIDADMEMVFTKALPRALGKAGASEDTAPVLRVEAGIYWAERANRAKRHIPIPVVGDHLSQAGVGVELVFTNDRGEIVAKFRHSGREGNRLQNAAEEIVGDIVRFIEQK